MTHSNPREIPAGAVRPDFFREQLLPLLGGVWALIVITKLGNPVNLDKLVDPPTNLIEAIFQPWPMAWGYIVLLIFSAVSVVLCRTRSAPRTWLKWVPLAWFGWQIVASFWTTDRILTGVTLWHFMGCLVCFYLGLYSLAVWPRSNLLWFGMAAGLLITLQAGFEQHFGGLAATREFVLSRNDPATLDPEYLKRLNSNRVFATFLYPNTFAGAILLLGPVAGSTLWHFTPLRGIPVRLAVTGGFAAAAAACLMWTSSKSAWLILGALFLVCLNRLRLSRKLRLVIAGVVLVGGTAVFFAQFREYFGRGATSVSARFDYWEAAGKTYLAHPLVGAGPGTFERSYRRLIKPGAEMARLAHNDYLQQASDSGTIGFLGYLMFWTGTLACLYRYSSSNSHLFAIWVGLLGFGMQSVVEFGLYIPAIGWMAFLLAGYLWGVGRSGGEAV